MGYSHATKISICKPRWCSWEVTGSLIAIVLLFAITQCCVLLACVACKCRSSVLVKQVYGNVMLAVPRCHIGMCNWTAIQWLFLRLYCFTVSVIRNNKKCITCDSSTRALLSKSLLFQNAKYEEIFVEHSRRSSLNNHNDVCANRLSLMYAQGLFRFIAMCDLLNGLLVVERLKSVVALGTFIMSEPLIHRNMPANSRRGLLPSSGSPKTQMWDTGAPLIQKDNKFSFFRKLADFAYPEGCYHKSCFHNYPNIKSVLEHVLGRIWWPSILLSIANPLFCEPSASVWSTIYFSSDRYWDAALQGLMRSHLA